MGGVRQAPAGAFDGVQLHYRGKYLCRVLLLVTQYVQTAVVYFLLQSVLPPRGVSGVGSFSLIIDLILRFSPGHLFPLSLKDYSTHDPQQLLPWRLFFFFSKLIQNPEVI